MEDHLNAPEWVLFETNTAFTLKPSSLLCVQKSLTIDKLSLKAVEHDICMQPQHLQNQITVFGLLGILNTRDSNFLMVIKERQEVLRFDDIDPTELPHIVYELTKVEFIKFDTNKNSNETNEILDKISKYITHGTFYGFNCDLTRSRQNQNFSRTECDLQGSDIRFMWNYQICKNLISQGIQKHWCIPLIQGNVGVQRPVPNTQMVLIARRRWKMGGTRFNARGIDDDGNVANHVELEQIFYITSVFDPPLSYKTDTGSQIVTKSAKLYSFVQVRGSMPFFWNQPSLTKIYLDGSIEHSSKAFKKHFEILREDTSNGPIACINLVKGHGNEHEVMLKERYEQMIGVCNLEYLSYRFFDFHSECHENSQPLVNLVDTQVWPQELINIGVFCKTYRLLESNGQQRVVAHVDSKQVGVVRTNCIDCLDRTNVAQQIICLKTVNEFVVNQNELPQKQVAESLIFLWAWAGDFISKQYSGTSSVLTKITLKGHQNLYDKFEQKMISVRRFQKQCLTDDFKQSCIDILQGLHLSTNNNFAEHQTSDMSFQAVTLNVGAVRPDSHRELHQMFIARADIVVVGLQEIVGTGALDKIQIFKKKDVHEETTQYSQLLLKALNMSNEIIQNTNKDDQYVFYQKKKHQGCVIFLFTKRKLLERVSCIQLWKADVCKIGHANNKGTVALKFKVDDTTFLVINTHLDSHAGDVVKRCENLMQIVEEAIGSKPNLIDRRTVAVVLGNLNFHIDLPENKIREAITKNNIQLLREHDEFLKMRKVAEQPDFLYENALNIYDVLKSKSFGQMVSLLNEGEITFLPSYKYQLNSQTFDSKRPSYVDRVFYVQSDCVRLKEYQSVPKVIFSAHKPVSALFIVKVFKMLAAEAKQDLPGLYPGFEESKIVNTENQHFEWLKQSSLKVSAISPDPSQKQSQYPAIANPYLPEELLPAITPILQAKPVESTYYPSFD